MTNISIPTSDYRTCKRCGANPVAWAKSARTGKFYLCTVNKHGEMVTHQPHQCHPDAVKAMDEAKAADKANGWTGDFTKGFTKLPDVPAGHYAVATEDGAINTLAFYRVDRPTEGKWAGYVFVKHIVGPEERRVPKAQTPTILAKIAADPAAASARYGKETRRCGVCHRNLTNDESRKIGIGPDCRANMGW